MRPTYNEFVFTQARMYARAWFSVNPTAINPDDVEGSIQHIAEKMMELAYRALVEEGGDVKSPRQILTEIGVNPDDYFNSSSPPVTGGGAGQVGRLSPDGPIFRVQNQPWRWIGATAFMLPQRHAEGENIDPFLDWAIATGFNLLRVGLALHYIPLQVGKSAFICTPEQLDRFLQKLLGRQIRCETTCGDMQILMPEFGRQQGLFNEWADVIARYELAVAETCNEPFKNGVDVLRHGRFGRGIVQASGNYDIHPQTGDQHMDAVLDYVTDHTPRDNEWPRKAKELYDLYGGWNENGNRFPGCRVPLVGDEPMGADEVNKPGSRSNVVDDHFDNGAVTSLMGAGGTFHSTDGVYARVPGPIQQQCATAYVAGANSISVDMPLGNYTRGYLADCPLEHDDALALRTFARILGNRAEAIVVRPKSAVRVARNGWQIVSFSGPNNRVVHLER